MYNQYFGNQNESFIGYYVSDYNEVVNIAAPMNGSPILFANLEQGCLWSKKMINGQTYIQPYKLEPINNVGVPKQPLNDVLNNDTINIIMDELKALKNEISTLNGGKSNEPK